MTYGDFKDTARRTATDNVLCDKAFNITKKLKYNGYQQGLASMVYIFLTKKLQIQTKEEELILVWFLKTKN